MHVYMGSAKWDMVTWDWDMSSDVAGIWKLGPGT